MPCLPFYRTSRQARSTGFHGMTVTQSEPLSPTPVELAAAA